MSALSRTGRTGGRGDWLRLRAGGRRGIGLRRVETVVLLLIGLLFAVATIYDLTRQVRIGDRLHADLVSWQAITGANYHNAFVELDAKHYTTRDVACGWTPATDPHKRAMTCLIFTGPVHGWHRVATGGYYLLGVGPARRRLAYDRARYRYGCNAGARSAGFRCRLHAPPGAPDKPLVRATA